MSSSRDRTHQDTASVTREYNVPKIPTFISTAGDPTFEVRPPAGSSARRNSVAPSATDDNSPNVHALPGSYSDAEDAAAHNMSAMDMGSSSVGLVITQNPQDTTYVMHNVVDNIMFSTNGYLGVKHRSETQTAVLRSYVKVNRVFHKVPLTQELRSLALPSSDEVGAVLCVVDLNVFINGEACSLLDMQYRSLSMRDACYRCGCLISNSNSEVSFTMKYCRFVSLESLSMWAAQLELSDFRFSGTGGPSFHVTVIAEICVAGDHWSTERRTCTGPSKFEEFVSTSLSSGVQVKTRSWAACSAVMPQTDSANATADAPQSPAVNIIRCSVDQQTYAHHRGEHSPQEQFQGPEEGCWGLSSAEEGDFADANGSSGSQSPRRKNWILSRKFEYELVNGKEPERISMVFLCEHTTAEEAAAGSPTTNAPATASTQEDDLCDVPNFVTRLKDAQLATLDAFWASFDVSVEYQDALHVGRLTLALRYSAFTAFCTGLGSRCGIARNGLSSPGMSMQLNLQHYVFHGMFYVLSAPQAAKKLMLHLIDMLPHARVHARRLSLSKGALYPHSTISGGECGSYFVTRSPRFHINADLAYFAFLFLDGAGNIISAEERMAIVEFLLDTARVWLEIGEWSEHHTWFRIDEITGPDEYTGLVEGNFYTHLSVKHQLQRTTQLVHDLLNSPVWKSQVQAVLDTLHISDADLSEMRDAADAIILHRDDRSGVYFAHDHFDSLKVWTGGPMNFPLYLNYPPLVVYRHKLCELPDVLLGMLLYPDEFQTLDIVRNLRYYEPLCTHDTPESLAIVAATHFRAYGDFGKGMPLLDAVAQLDLDNLTYTAEDGIHLSAMTSSWVTVAFGIGGLRIKDGTLHLYPSLPVGIEVVVFTIHWNGSVVRVSITAEHIEYRLVKGDSFRLIHFDHTRVHLHGGRGDAFQPQLHATIPRVVAQHMTAHFDGVVFSVECLVENLLEINYQAWCRVLNPFFDEIGTHSDPPRQLPHLTLDEYVHRMIYQEEDRFATYSGLHQVLTARGIDLELGSASDMEIVATRFGLANAKVEELRVLLSQETLRLVDGAIPLLRDMKTLGIRVALVTYTRSMHDVLQQFPELSDIFTTMIDGAEVREKRMLGRPHMDIFVNAARKMHIPTKRCVVVATHLDRGYKERDVQQFVALLDVEEIVTTSLQKQQPMPTPSPLVASATATPLRAVTESALSPRASCTFSNSCDLKGEYCSANVLLVERGCFPRSVADLEDVIVGASIRRRGRSILSGGE